MIKKGAIGIGILFFIVIVIVVISVIVGGAKPVPMRLNFEPI